jgi:SnoaL-like domain
MSEENVELVRQAYEAWNRGDLEWLLDHLDPDGEFRTEQRFPDTEAIYRGREGFTQFWNTFRDPWEPCLSKSSASSPSGTIGCLVCSSSMGAGGVESRRGWNTPSCLRSRTSW